MQDLPALCKATRAIVADTATFISEQAKTFSEESVQFKDFNDLVSYVDKTAEKMLVKALSELLPEAVFLTEEGTIKAAKGKYRWIIDPLDGTTNFVQGIPTYAVSVALERDGELILGIVHEVNRQECFYAWKDGGAYLNGEPINVRDNHELGKSLWATGFPYTDFRFLDLCMAIQKELVQQTRGIRRLGAAAVDLCYVACGRLDGYYEYSIKPWDIAAGWLIVNEAGGAVSDFSGEQNCFDKQEIIAASPLMFEKIKAIFIKMNQ